MDRWLWRLVVTAVVRIGLFNGRGRVRRVLTFGRRMLERLSRCGVGLVSLVLVVLTGLTGHVFLFGYGLRRVNVLCLWLFRCCLSDICQSGVCLRLLRVPVMVVRWVVSS